jgi:TolB protein
MGRRVPAIARLIAVVALVGGAAALTLVAAPRARAQAGGDDSLPEAVKIKITDPTRDLIRIAVPPATGDTGAGVGDILAKDLDLSGFFRILDRKSFLANLAAEGLSIVPADWTNVGAQWVTKAQMKQAAGGRVFLDLRLYQPAKGPDPALSKALLAENAGQVRRRVHEWAALVVKFITDQDSFFGSRFAFGGTGHGVREIYTMDFDGHGIARVTNMNSISILPSWSPSGGQIAFTSFARDNPDLWIVSSGGGRARRVAHYPGLNTGPAWSPDGSKIAVTLSKDGNAEIYLIRPADGGIIARLTNDPGIDTSPTWSPDGSQIAFVSDRHGSPQIYVMSARGGAARRITFQGNYNQTPRWCPRRDVNLIAFSGRDQRGRYDIFTVDPSTTKITRVTQGFGSNLDPAWAPNGKRLAFVNIGSKPGIWLVNPDGTNPVQVSKTGANGLAWGPAPK